MTWMTSRRGIQDGLHWMNNHRRTRYEFSTGWVRLICRVTYFYDREEWHQKVDTSCWRYHEDASEVPLNSTRYWRCMRVGWLIIRITRIIVLESCCEGRSCLMPSSKLRHKANTIVRYCLLISATNHIEASQFNRSILSCESTPIVAVSCLTSRNKYWSTDVSMSSAPEEADEDSEEEQSGAIGRHSKRQIGTSQAPTWSWKVGG